MGKIRITSGTLRGRVIRSPEGEATRPLLTRVRKSLLDILHPRLAGAQALDLFAGSGAIGIELVSNGAQRCVLVELTPQTADLVRQNIAELGVAAEVHTGDARAFLDSWRGGGDTFDLVIVAPPYGLGLQQDILDRLQRVPLLRPGGLVVVQRDAKEPAGRVDPAVLTVADQRKYGRTVLEFYTPAGGPGADRSG